jgi:hypothetical protein
MQDTSKSSRARDFFSSFRVHTGSQEAFHEPGREKGLTHRRKDAKDKRARISFRIAKSTNPEDSGESPGEELKLLFFAAPRLCGFA